MSLPNVIDWLRAILAGIDELVFDEGPRFVGRYAGELPMPVIVAGFIVASGAVVYLTLWPTQKGDVSNVGVVMVYNAAVKAVTGLCVLAFYGSVFALMAIGIMRLLP